MSIVEYLGPSDPQAVRKYWERRGKDEIIRELLRVQREYQKALRRANDSERLYREALRGEIDPTPTQGDPPCPTT